MLRVRLARQGRKGRPFYHIVVADVRSPRDGRYIEKIGFFNPLLVRGHPLRVSLQDKRIRYWTSVGALMTDRVQKILKEFQSAASCSDSTPEVQ